MHECGYKLAAETCFKGFSIRAIRKTPSHIVLIVAPLAASTPILYAAITIEGVHRI